MGQCLFCSRTNTTNIDAMEEKESLTLPTEPSDKSLDQSARQSGIDSAPDSGHSSGDEASCGGGAGDGNSSGCGVGLTAVEVQGRNSHSSESSGKYSMRGSIGSCGDCERSHPFPARIDEYSIDMPVFEEKNQLEDDDDGGVFTHDGGQDSLHPLQDVTRPRNFSRGSSRGSRGSSSSERGSFSSVTSVTAILKARLGRSSSLSVQPDLPEAEVLSTCSCVLPAEAERSHRTVSLRLPSSHRRPHDSDTNLPTIYVDDTPQQQNARRRERKSSLQRALSLLSMNSLLRHDSTSSSSKKAQKPVQKILRQPRRRHNTVRGLSGLAIDRSNQSISYPGLQRAQTLYYPTATSLRYASAARRTKSVTT